MPIRPDQKDLAVVSFLYDPAIDSSDTSYPGYQLLPFDVVTSWNSTDTKLCVKVPQAFNYPEFGSGLDFPVGYIYYGSATANAGADSTQAYDFYDDFAAGCLYGMCQALQPGILATRSSS